MAGKAQAIGLLELQRPDGLWLVEGDTLKQMIRSYTCAEVFLKNYAVKTLEESEKESFGETLSRKIFGAFLPEVKVIDMDMPKLQREIKRLAGKRFQEFIRDKHTPMVSSKVTLVAKVQQGKRDRDLFRSKTRALQKRNSDKIETSVKQYEFAVETSKVVRDSSVDVLIVGATVATGGTGGALVAISGGAGLLKGAAKYQDTGNVGAAVITGTTSAITTLIKIPAGKMPPGSEKVATEGCVIFFEVAGDVGSDLVTGKDVTEALQDAATKQVVGLGVGKAMDKVNLESSLKTMVGARGWRTPIPSITQPILVEIGKKSVEKTGEVGVKAGIGILVSPDKEENDSTGVITTGAMGVIDKLDYIIQKVN